MNFLRCGAYGKSPANITPSLPFSLPPSLPPSLLRHLIDGGVETDQNRQRVSAGATGPSCLREGRRDRGRAGRREGGRGREREDGREENEWHERRASYMARRKRSPLSSSSPPPPPLLPLPHSPPSPLPAATRRRWLLESPCGASGPDFPRPPLGREGGREEGREGGREGGRVGGQESPLERFGSVVPSSRAQVAVTPRSRPEKSSSSMRRRSS
jgi:hypothetical protein